MSKTTLEVLTDMRAYHVDQVSRADHELASLTPFGKSSFEKPIRDYANRHRAFVDVCDELIAKLASPRT